MGHRAHPCIEVFTDVTYTDPVDDLQLNYQPSDISKMDSVNVEAHPATDANGKFHCIKGGTTASEKTVNNKPGAESFLRQLFDLLLEKGIKEGSDVNRKIVEFVHPADLLAKLDLGVRDAGESNETLIQLCEQTLKYSVKTGHPRFFNQLYGGQNVYGIGGSWLTETLNTSQYTYEVAPVFTLMEKVVLDKLRELVGYEDGDGIFCPGGSISNMYGLSLARFHTFPQVKEDGMQALPKVCMFTSAQSHYSLKKGASFMGFGTSSLRIVPCDSRGKMIPQHLERLIKEAKDEGIVPFFVNATAGTTVVGAYDPLDEIAEICERYGLWMHVDTCWGGGALLSNTHKYLLKGIERADSVAWNPHKMMGAPLQCCAFLTRHTDLMKECHSADAKYLFQQDKFYDVSYDTGDKAVQCGRKVDVFKLWLMWKAEGSIGFEKSIDNMFAMSKYLAERIQETEGFRLVFEPECTNVCFWFIPPSMRGKPETDEWWQQLAKVAPELKKLMVEQGTMLIGYNPLGSYVNFFRMVISNPDVRKEDMDFVISDIERMGNDL